MTAPALIAHPVTEYRPMSIEKRIRIELPDDERGRSEYELAELDRVNARLARGYKPHRGQSADQQREADLARRGELEGRAEAKRNAQEIAAGQAETEALAEGRGETVSEDRSGVRRILDRDPLLSLARAGHLTPDQLEVGQVVRELYDRRQEDAGAIEYSDAPRSPANLDRLHARHFNRAKACEMVGRIERKVAIDCSAEPACLTMLRIVCERGMTVNSQGEGRAFKRNAQALARALDVADPVLRRQA